MPPPRRQHGLRFARILLGRGASLEAEDQEDQEDRQ